MMIDRLSEKAVFRKIDFYSPILCVLRIRKEVGRINPNETKKSYDLHIVIKNYKAGVGKPLFMLMKMRVLCWALK